MNDGIANIISTDIPILLSYYETKLSLLLSISQTRSGAVHIVNSGLFQAVRGSGLFSVDPDIGVGKCRSLAQARHAEISRNQQPRGTSQVLQATLVHCTCNHLCCP